MRGQLAFLPGARPADIGRVGLRKAAASEVQVPLVGCGCHALQLAPKHVLPVRPDRTAPGSSSDSSPSSPCSSEAAAARGGPRAPSPERAELTRQLREPLGRARKLVRHYVRSSDSFKELQADATEANAPVLSFATETVTRWNSTVDLLARELFNDRALAVSAAKRGERAGVERLSPAGKQLQLELCAVLQPRRQATKMLEGGGQKGRVSHYLPVWERLRLSLANPGPLPLPAELREVFPQGVSAEALQPLPKKLRAWLAKDLKRIRAKHMAGTTGAQLVLAATFLDPRFKDFPRQAGEPGPVWCTDQELQATRAFVKVEAARAAEQFPALVEQHKRAAAMPDNQPLAAFAPPPAKRARRARRVVAEDEPVAAAVSAAAAAPPAPRPPRRLAPQTSAEEFLFGGSTSASASSGAAPRAAVAALEAGIESQLVRFHALPQVELATLDLCSWWKEHAWQFPHLAVFAKHLLGLPASTAALERLFSAAGRAVTHRRARLQDASAANLIFGHANVRRGHTGC